MTSFGDEKPVEDVLEQWREDEPTEYDERFPAQLPPETDEADYTDQQIAVPVDDER